MQFLMQLCSWLCIQVCIGNTLVRTGMDEEVVAHKAVVLSEMLVFKCEMSWQRISYILPFNLDPAVG